MGRKSSTGFPLTWKPHGKRKGKRVAGSQWVKKIDGKQVSSGPAPSNRDPEAKEEALAKFQRSSHDPQLRKMIRQYMSEIAEREGWDPDQPAELKSGTRSFGSRKRTWTIRVILHHPFRVIKDVNNYCLQAIA